jgi:hypothetical protein
VVSPELNRQISRGEMVEEGEYERDASVQNESSHISKELFNL